MTLNLTDFPQTIHGAQCELRYMTPNPENAGCVFGAIDGCRAFLKSWLGFVGMIQTSDDAMRWLNQAAEQWADQKKFQMGIFCDGQFVGCIGAFDIEPAPVASAKIGYWLNQSATGRGIMADALNTLETELFARGFNRLEIQIDAGNDPSIRVAVRAGYHLDGILRAASYAPLVGVCDLYIYSKLAAESEQHV